MDIDEEFESLCLPQEKISLAWQAREKIMWGEPARQVQAWLVVLGIDRFTAKRIVAIAVRQQAREYRRAVARYLVPGLLLGVGGAAAGIAGMLMDGRWFSENNWIPEFTAGGLVEMVGFATCVCGVLLTWRGLAFLLSGARCEEPTDEGQEGG